MSECRCERFEHPPGMTIPAGLTVIPRQIATFYEFRRAMLAAIRRYRAVDGWSACSDDDFGIMLLEMWAYVADVQSFYDEVVAHEAYLRTARLRPSVRKLTGLLGYVPKPAVASTVSLALLAEGRKAIALPKGLAFRSSAFDNEAPQIFELCSETTIHPLNGRWPLEPPRRCTLSITGDASTQSFGQLLMTSGATLKQGDIVLVSVGSSDADTQASTVAGIADTEGDDGGKYKQVDFSPALLLAGGTDPESVGISKTTQTGGLWKATQASGGLQVAQVSGIAISEATHSIEDHITLNKENVAYEKKAIASSQEHVAPEKKDIGHEMAVYIYGDPVSLSGNTIVLDGLYRSIKPGQYIILTREQEYRWFKVAENRETMMTISPADTTTVTDSQNNPVTVAVPAVKAPATQLVLDVSVNDGSRRQAGNDTGDWTSSDASKITLHYGFTSAGAVTVPAGSTIVPADKLIISGRIEEPVDATAPERFLVQDKNETGLELTGTLDYDTRDVRLDQRENWTVPLTTPVSLYGNIVSASRGETVEAEILGSGDASLSNQSFTLKKSPLTYVSCPTADNELGAVSTLKVYVDGVLWKEVPNFYGTDPRAQVYIVRQNDDGESIVTFGDGRRGARLTTGVDNVVAAYRHGAGKAAPPAGAITQLAKPVKGLSAVKSPVAAKGGDDAEASDSLRSYAPQSALLLGRAVSIADTEAVAAGVPGVRAVTVEWQWNEIKQCPVVQLWYIGDDDIKTDIEQRLRSLTDPSMPIAVDVASPVVYTLLIDVEIDGRYLDDDVLSEVRTALMDKEAGLLSPERIGIGKPLFRSRVFEAVTAVEGVGSIQGIWLRSPEILGHVPQHGLGRPPHFRRSAAMYALRLQSHISPSAKERGKRSLSAVFRSAAPNITRSDKASDTALTVESIMRFALPRVKRPGKPYIRTTTPWIVFALRPGAGRYFDFETGGLILNGKESEGG